MLARDLETAPKGDKEQKEAVKPCRMSADDAPVNELNLSSSATQRETDVSY